MAPRDGRLAAALLATFLLFPLGVRLDAACDSGRVPFDQAVLEAIFADEKSKVEDASVQVSSPSSTGSSTALVDRPSFPSVLGMAIESGLVRTEDNAINVDLNLFAFVGMFRPVVLTSPTEYQKYTAVRRFGGAVTFGGKGERFDLSGNEQTEPPSSRRTDVIHYEVRYRLTQSRDVREAYNAKEFEPTHERQVEFSRTFAEFLQIPVLHTALLALQDGNGCVDPGEAAAVFGRPAIRESLAKVRSAASGLATELTAARKRIENRPVWTLVAGGVRQKETFGPNSLKIALRGEVGRQTLNAEWRRSDELVGGTRPAIFKGGWEGSLLWLKGSQIAPAGIDVSVSAALQKFQDVPAAKHDTIGTVNLKLEYPLSKAIKIPVSVTWANHKDLLTNETEVRGHIGFTVDLDKALKVGEGGSSASGDASR